MKRTWMLIIAALLSLVLFGCATDSDGQIFTLPTDTEATSIDKGEVVILYSGGLDDIYAQDTSLGQIGYASLTAYRSLLESNGNQVVLVDCGSSVSGVDNGMRWDIVDAVEYDIRVPGISELSGGVDALLEHADGLKECTYLSCNLMELNSGTTVFQPYVIVNAGEAEIAFVGITSPKAARFIGKEYSLLQEDGGQAFYDAVQQAIDDAEAAGADYVIGVGNLGADIDDSPWTLVDVITNTTGFSAYLDCGSVLEGYLVTDMDNFEIPVCAVGSEFNYVGEITLNLNDGTVKVSLLDALAEEDREIRSMADELALEEDESTE